jgi:peptidoglycan hydrolase-like protein with peptidoglycan-binding domain
MLALRILLLPFCVFGLLSAVTARAVAETYGYEIRLTQSIFGERVFKGEIAPQNGRFEEFVEDGNTRVHFTGSVSGDQVSVYGELILTGNWRFKPFRVDGAFSGSTFTRSVVASSEMGPSARGSVTITRPATPVAAAPAIDLNPKSQVASTRPATGSFALSRKVQIQTAPLPPVPQEPPLGRKQRMDVQRQLSALGLYRSAVDGAFGLETRKAIRSFQRDNGLTATGYLTDATVARLSEKVGIRQRQLVVGRQTPPQENAPEPPAAQASESVQRMTLPTAQAAAVPAPAEAPQPSAPVDGFDAVVATLKPIDETFVAVKPANVRAAPKVTADLVDMLTIGDRIDVLGRLPREDWYLVAREGEPIGYVVVGQLASETALAETRAMPPVAAAEAEPSTALAIAPELAALDYGRYHAIVIGNDGYASLPRLNTAVADAKAVAAILEQDYGFNVSLLTDATEAAIVGTVTDLRRTLGPKDNLLIYYAGHGWYDGEAERGYWLPIDAALDNRSNWISNADVTDMLKAIKAKHVIVVADSCYSGTLTRGLAIGGKSTGYIQDIVQRRARTVLTSGGLEPVLDGGGGGNSVFADAFLDALRGNAGVIDGEGIYQRVKDQVLLNAEQTPEYGNIRLAGHDGGDFLFVRKR